MSLAFSQADIIRFKNKADRIVAKGRAMADRQAETIETVIISSEVSAASFMFGLAQGKFGGIAIVGVPFDLLAGLSLHILAFAGVGGRNAAHLHAFGDGALASFFGGLGRQVGRKIQTPNDRERILKHAPPEDRARLSAILTAGGSLSGDTTGGGALADEELARMVAASH